MLSTKLCASNFSVYHILFSLCVLWLQTTNGFVKQTTSTRLSIYTIHNLNRKYASKFVSKDNSNNRKEELNTQQHPSGRVLAQRSKQGKNHIDQREIDSIIIRTRWITRDHAGFQFLRVGIDSTKETRSVATWEVDVWDKESIWRAEAARG